MMSTGIKRRRIVLSALLAVAMFSQFPVANAAPPANQPPVAQDDTATTREERRVNISILANDSDPDGDPFTLVTATDPANGRIQILRNRANPSRDRIRYTPNRDFFGVDTFDYTICDDKGECDTATVTITVTNRNDAPRPGRDVVATDEDVPAYFDVLANDIDPDGDPLTIVRVTRTRNGTAVIDDSGTADPSDDTILYTPNAEYSGADRLWYRVCDPNRSCRWSRVDITVRLVNDPPIAGDDLAVTDEDSPVTHDVLANDTDVDGTIDPTSVTIVTQPADGVGTADPVTGAVTYTPDPDFYGSDVLEYQVCDDGGACSTAAVTITVAPLPDVPVAGDDAATGDEDEDIVVDVLANDSDVDGDVLAILLVTPPARGSVQVEDGGTPSDPSDDTVRYTPEPDYFGADSFTYTVCDPGGLCDTAIVLVTVDSVNDAPIARDDTATTDEDTPVAVDVAANDDDIDGLVDPTTVTLTALPARGAAEVDPVTGVVTYGPDRDFNGSDVFSYEICDDGGACASAIVELTVLPVNDTPVAGDDTAATAEDTAVSVAVLANDSDPDGDQLTITTVTQPAEGTAAIDDSGTPGDPTDDTVRFVPAPDFNGTAAFSYTACDPDGACGVATVVVTVEPVNDAPRASDDGATTSEDVPLTTDVRENDTDVDGDALAVSSVTQGAHGVATIDPAGTVTYVPAANFHGSDVLTYEVCDPSGECDTGTFVVTVTPVNDAPVAGDDAATVNEDASVKISVLGDDTDLDGDPLTIAAVGHANVGDVTIDRAGTPDPSDDRLVYTPPANYHGAASFTYDVCDPAGLCATGTVTVDVLPVNDRPRAADDSAANVPGLPVTVDVLANDVDIDGDPLGITSVDTPATGSVEILEGALVYTPTDGFVGETSFRYTTCDPGGACSTASVTIDVKTLGSVTGIVWLDRDRDGTISGDEVDVSDVRLVLTAGGTDGILGTSDDELIGTAFTASPYWFRGLLPGTYKLTVDATTLPAGYVSAVAEETAEMSATVTVGWGETQSADFAVVDTAWFVSAGGSGAEAEAETLPFTGIETAHLSFVGALMAAAGVVLVLLARRRTPVSVRGHA